MRTMEDDVKKLAMLGVADKYRLADIKERLDMGKDLYISDKEFLENRCQMYVNQNQRLYQNRSQLYINPNRNFLRQKKHLLRNLESKN